MKPNPFFVSNHLTVPVGMAVLPQELPARGVNALAADPNPARQASAIRSGADVPASAGAPLSIVRDRSTPLHITAGLGTPIIFGFLRVAPEPSADASAETGCRGR